MSKEIKKKKNENVGYKGQVELGIIKNGKKYKKITANKGKSELFTYLCKCLAAQINPNVQVDLSDRPGKLRVLDASNNRIIAYDISLSDVSIISGVDEYPSSITFSFLVPGTSVFNRAVKNVQLISMTGDTVLAEAGFSKAIIITDVDTNIYVT